MEKDTSLILRIESDLKEKIRLTAKEERRSLSEMSAILLMEGLKRHQGEDYLYLKEQLTR